MLSEAVDKMCPMAADLVVVVHPLFISFVIGVAFLPWRWPRTAWVHAPVALSGPWRSSAGFTCPLTAPENDLRNRAGGRYRAGFIAHYLVKAIYPPGLTRDMQAGRRRPGPDDHDRRLLGVLHRHGRTHDRCARGQYSRRLGANGRTRALAVQLQCSASVCAGIAAES